MKAVRAILGALAGVLVLGLGGWAGGAFSPAHAAPGAPPRVSAGAEYPRRAETGEIRIGDSLVVNGQPMQLSVFYTADPARRVVDFYACRSNATGAACIAAGSNKVILHAQVAYNDYSTAGQNACGPSFVPNSIPPMVQTCGTAMTVNTWDIATADT